MENKHSTDLNADWEKKVLLQLYAEYRHALHQYRVKLTPALLELSSSESHWGQWNRLTRTIQISRRLLLEQPWFHVVGVLKHEMAHQLVDEAMGSSSRNGGTPHGVDFKRACERLGVPEVYARASVNLQAESLDWRTEKRDEVSEKMLDRVRKLLALATSTNEHEAALAMNRVREIYAKYNLENAVKDDFVHLVINTGLKRVSIFEKTIMGILVGHFFVEAILGAGYNVQAGGHERSIEIIGKRENVLMAEYVYHFLQTQSADLARALMEKRAQAGERISTVARKSYRLGILRGFSEKLRAAERPRETAETQNSSLIGTALAVFKKDRELDGYIGRVYPRLVTSRSGSQRLDSSAYDAGRKVGGQISLNKPVTSSGAKLGRFLTGR